MKFVPIVAVVAAVVAGVGVGAWLAGRGGSSSAPTVTTSQSSGIRVDSHDAYLVAGRSGAVAVGLAAHAGGPVDVIVIPPDLKPPPASDVRAGIGRATQPPTSCGPSCYRFPLRVLDGAPATLTVAIRGRATEFRLPARLPPQARSLFHSASRRMSRLRSVRVDESLSSGLTAVRARFALAAPDRSRYVTSSGQRAVVIGTTRWDWIGGRWQKSQYQRTRQPAYMWEGARYARVLGQARLGGRRVTVVSTFRPDPDYPAWMRLYVTPDRRIARADMVAPAHFMVDRLSAFNHAGPIRPPARSSG